MVATMRLTKLAILAACTALLISASPAISSAESVTAPSATSTSASVNGKALIDQKCTLCHTLERVEAKGATKPSQADWTSLVDRMKSKGCPVTDQEEQEIVKYLVATYSGGATAAAAPAASTTGGASTTATNNAAAPAAAAPAANGTPAEQAQTGAEDWIFPILGLSMVCAGIIMRRREAGAE